MARYSMSCLVVCTLTASVFAVDPNPESLTITRDQLVKAEQLVRRLGSNSFQERDRAYRELRNMGRIARAALVTGQAETDAEVRYRCRTLLPEAEADDFDARSAAFLADTEGKYVHDLPGWNKYRLVAGEDLRARELFVDILKDPKNRALLIALQGIPRDRVNCFAGLAGSLAGVGAERSKSKEMVEALETRRMAFVEPFLPNGNIAFRGRGVRFVNQPNAAPNQSSVVPDLAAVLLASCFIDGGDEQLPGQAVFQQQLNQPQVTTLMVKDSKNPAFRRLLMNWFETRTHFEEQLMVAYLSQQWGMGPKAIVHYSSRAVLNENTDTNRAAWMLTTIAQQGGKDALPTFEQLLKDDRVIPNGLDMQMRDVALIMILALTNQNCSKFDLQDMSGGNIQAKFNYGNYRFIMKPGETMEAKREKVLKKWREWQTEMNAVCAGPAAASVSVEKKYPVETAEEKKKRAEKKEAVKNGNKSDD